MKVCHLTTVHQPFDTRIFYKECKTLVNAGYDVTLIAQHDKSGSRDGINIIALSKAKNRLHRAVVLSSQIFRLAMKERADIYHFHDSELILIGILLKLLGKRVIYDAHEDVPRDIMTKEWIPIYIRKVVSSLFEMLENVSAKYMDVVITATPFIRSRFQRLGCRVIDINNYPLLNELHKHEVNWTNKKKAVCYVGLIEIMRGVIEMVGAINNTDATLLLAGKFLNSKQRDKVMALPGWKKVCEMGQINRKEVASILSSSMAGLVLFHPVPNNINAQPNKMFEYMSAGIPVIASDFPLWKDIIEGNQCGICVDCSDEKKIANAIQWIIDNPWEARVQGMNGRRAVEDKYNWEQESKKLLLIYKGIVE